ncbi:ADP-ribosylglycohydrolase [Gammaproteobacteria bacterium 42_54_T18]|nr:ADP-ribosylglycohydrolase [Gammaproteobacteria bacterium 42_54_T18]
MAKQELNKMDIIERYQGCLLGLAVGDAIGTTVEFMDRGSFPPVIDMVGGGPFDLEAGQWTDDTSMALCLAHSLVHCEGFDASDQMNRYCNWWQYGYMSSTGECFDIGMTVSDALARYMETKNSFAGSIDPFSAGNGSLMRLAPVALFYGQDIGLLLKYAAESSRTTHGAVECIDACRYFATVLRVALFAETKLEVIKSNLYSPETEKVKAIASGEYVGKPAGVIKGSGYVIESLEAALWCFANTDSYDEAVLLAANLGDDADTTAAICGQVAGAYYGIKGIRENWLDKLVMRDEMMALSIKLLRKQRCGLVNYS